MVSAQSQPWPRPISVSVARISQHVQTVAIGCFPAVSRHLRGRFLAAAHEDRAPPASRGHRPGPKNGFSTIFQLSRPD